MNKQKMAILITTLVGCLAAFMPWAILPFVGPVSGFSGDGKITLFLFLATVTMIFIGPPYSFLPTGEPLHRRAKAIIFLINLLTFGIMIWKATQIPERVLPFIALGFWLTLVASLLNMAFSGMWHFFGRNKKSVLSTFLLIISTSLFPIFSQSVTYEDLQAGTVKPGKYEAYTSKDGGIYRVGEKIQILSPAGTNGRFITIQKLDFAANYHVVGTEAINTHAEIKHIYVSGNKRSGYKAQVQTKGYTSLDNYYIYVEDAIALGELRTTGMSSKQALEELKMAKDKLDLGLISTEEYEIIRKELAPLIK